MSVHYEVECQDVAEHGRHVAEFSHVNQYGQNIYHVVCDGYIEKYTDEVIIEVEDPARVPGSAIGIGSKIITRKNGTGTVKRITGKGMILDFGNDVVRTAKLDPNKWYIVANGSAHNV